MLKRRVRLACAITLSLSAAACASAPHGAHGDSGAYANFLIGRLADMREDHQAASDHLVGAARLSPDDPDIVENAITASLAAGEIARAREIAGLAASRNVHVAFGDLLLGVDALSAERWGQARTRFAAVRGGAAEQLTGRVLAAWASAASGRSANESDALAALAMSRPYSALFAYQHAMILDGAGDSQGARAAYEQANQQGLWLPPALERQADFLARNGAPVEAQGVLDPMRSAGANPALAAARLRLEAGQSISETPLTPARGAAISLYGLGTILIRETEFADGLAVMSLALTLDPQLDAARIAFAQAHADLGHPEEASDALAQIPQSSPYRVTANSMLAWQLQDEGESAAAIAMAQANAIGGNVLAVRALADLYRANENFAEAEPIYTRIIDAQTADAGDWRLYFARGAVRERLGRLRESEADMRQALALSPDQPDVLNYLGYTLVDRTPRVAEGMALITRAVELRPSSGAIVDSLGWAYFHQGQYQRALELLERAVELEPADPTLNDHLGDVYWRLGRRIEARFQWRRALSLDAPTSDRAAIETKIQRGLVASAAPNR